jgi:hypothetical protein
LTEIKQNYIEKKWLLLKINGENLQGKASQLQDGEGRIQIYLIVMKFALAKTNEIQ